MHLPVSTYRLQLNRECTFDDVCGLVPYFAELGVDWLYLSPIFAARPGSPHGYDAVDPTVVNEELGGRAGLERLASDAHAASLRLLLDIVPNHQAVTTRNPRWYALLRDGAGSDAARWFDVDWSGNDGVAPGKLLWPLLGRSPDEEIASGDLRIEATSRGERRLRYHDELLPLHGADLPLADALTKQPYVLAQWRAGMSYVNYRRFFDINDLAGVRVEDPGVFASSHALVLELLANGTVDGLRVDHVDGLADPAEYLHRLPGTFVVVEKILAAGETLPATWPVAGTTGYETLADLTAVLLDPDGRDELAAAASRELEGTDFATIAHDAKQRVLRTAFVPEWHRVVAALRHVLGDGVDDAVAAALEAVAVRLGVYRTYCHDRAAEGFDREVITRALAAARAGGVDERAVATVGRVLLGDDLPAAALQARAAFMVRWQQLTGAVTAKGHEDTACYRFPAALAQAEVGDDPGASVAGAVEHFHARMAARVDDRHPGLTATTTHDTKRGEDTRARLAVLTERAGAFEAALPGWVAAVRPADGVTSSELRFLAQTLLATWPLETSRLNGYAERMREYVVKALREAKWQTSWLDPDERHEQAAIAVAEASIRDGGRLLHDAFGELVADVAWYGAINGLAQLTWKLAAPGTADVYRGCELWDLSLVDPDNRRPVDFDLRATMLREHSDDWRSGAVKLHMTAAGLRIRREHRDLFHLGRYVPLPVAGDAALAFARAAEGRGAIACAPRLPTRLAPRDRWPVGARVWGDRTLDLPAGAPGRWRDVYTDTELEAADGRLRVADVLTRLPAALLVSA
jgi:malto-oligosyltrehalose synthase